MNRKEVIDLLWNKKIPLTEKECNLMCALIEAEEYKHYLEIKEDDFCEV